MLKVFTTIAALTFTTSAFAEANPKVRGCSFNVTSYYKGVTPVTANWSHGFDVEKRQGWGFPMNKKDDALNESYVGQVDLWDSNSKLEVEVSVQRGQLYVKATAKKVADGKVEVLATGWGKAITSASDAYGVTAMVGIQNPLVASIQATAGESSDVMDSPLFPQKTNVFGNANVVCFADFQ